MIEQESSQVDEVIRDELRSLFLIAEVFSLNINRSLRLLHASSGSRENIDSDEIFLEYMDDILRAVVVFLHSALETTLREIVGFKLKCGSDVSYIPLAGQPESQHRKEKFSLQDLARHRKKSVDEVIAESVDEYLKTLSFNSTTDIANTFERIGLPQSSLRQHYSNLQRMIDRRHQIVHEADLARDYGASKLKPIQIERMQVWIDTTTQFCTEVMRLAIDAIYLDRIMERLEAIGIQVERDSIARRITVEIERKY